MKKGLLNGFLITLLIGVASCLSFANINEYSVNNVKPTQALILKAEALDETEEADTEVEAECYVTLSQSEHGTITADILEGNIGDIVTLNVNADLFYITSNVSVNGVSLIESETTKGLYSFTLSSGENIVTATFIIDEELFGELTTIVEEIDNKDWTHLFTVENVITIIKWLLDCGILIAVIRYFVKDKKLAKKLEQSVTEVTEKIVPESTKQAVLENTKELIEPMFKKITEDSTLTREIMAIVIKCMVLMQQDTPEAKIAILNEFEKLQGIVDLNSVENIKKYIDESVEKHNQVYQETLQKLKDIENYHKEITKAKNDKKTSETEVKDNGTQI